MKELKNIRVLVTGAGGFIGQHLVKKLVESGAEVGAVYFRSLSSLKKATATHCFVGDIKDSHFLNNLIENFRPQIAYHLAALVGEQVNFSPEEQAEVNVQATLKLLEASANKIELFIFPSTAEVYGKSSLPFREDCPPRPLSLYGASKAAAENYVLSFHYRNELKASVLRIFSVYGPGQKPVMFIPQLIDALIKGKTFLTTNLSKRRDFIFIDDVIEAFLKVPLFPQSWGEIINIGSGKSTSLREVVKTLQEVTLKKIKVVEGAKADKRGDVKIQRANITKAQKKLLWKASTPIEEGLRKTYLHFTKCHNYHS